MSSQPTPEQSAAIDSQEARFTVRASAGAGKTRVLVARYLRHVVDGGLRPDQILTITFTRKAAAEMKRRIVNELRSLARFDDAQIAETGPIQTIHGFCERALRENSLAAGVDPEFEILSASQASLLRERILLEALAEDHEESPLVRALVNELAGRTEYNSPATLQAKLASATQSVLSDLRGSGASIEQLAQRYRSVDALRASFDEAIRESLVDPVKAALSGGALTRQSIAAACKATKTKQPTWLSKVADDAEPHAMDQTCGLVQLSLNVWGRLEREMVRLQQFDFAYLEARTVRLLVENDSVCSRLRRQYRAVLIDEAQDVNPVQYRLIDALRAEGEMMVGDAKQSIYGFRQADPRLFRERVNNAPGHQLTQNFRSGEGILRFVDSLFGKLWPDDYEPMAPPIFKDTDDPFEGPAAGSFDGVEIWPTRAKDSAMVAVWLSQLLAEGIPRRDIAVLVRHAAYATDLSARLHRLGIDHRIAGGSEKFYTRLVVRDLANALQALSDPSDDFALLAMLRSPVVDLSIDAIVLLSLARPVSDALKTFVSPVEGDAEKIEEFLRWFGPLSGYADRLAAWEVLGEIFHRSHYLERLAARPDGNQELANARKLLALAAQEPEAGPQAFAEQIRDIQLMRHQEGDAPSSDDDADAVTIMTIHKAKGLEFPVVVIPDTHYGLEKPARDVVSDMETGLVATKFGVKGSLAHAWLAAKKKARDREEELRVLYVALTRAKSRLCVCLHNEAQDTRPAGLMARLLGFSNDALPGTIVRRPLVVRSASEADEP